MNIDKEEHINKPKKEIVQPFKNFWFLIIIVLILLFIISLFFNFFEINISLKNKKQSQTLRPEMASQESSSNQELIEAVLPQKGVELPIIWGDLGKQLIESGVIDKEKFTALYKQRGGLDEYSRGLLEAEDNNNRIIISEENANILLNLFWAFGLSNKNPILEQGLMTDQRYGGDPSRFASTGGWILAKGNAMDHYSKHAFIKLTPNQQELVERVSKNIFRPCCNNPTYFPDCNHGMAMLGLIELMASQNVGEEEMYQVALKVNSYWFPQTYLTIAKYFKKQGIAWSKVNPKLVLGKSFSSAFGYRRILSEVEPIQKGGGGGCGV